MSQGDIEGLPGARKVLLGLNNVVLGVREVLLVTGCQEGARKVLLCV